MNLATLIPAETAREVTGITCDSRRVEKGDLFAALSGVKTDGSRFIDQAVDRGATVVLARQGITSRHADQAGVKMINVANPRRLYSLAAAHFFGRQPETTAAVTGTNGKSSVADFLRQIWTALGLRAASLGTIGVVGPDDLNIPLQHTTPDPAELHALLADLKDRGIEHLAMEASSHGLAQYRTDGVRFIAAAFTNLSRDHLDYHDSLDSYLLAKMRLFGELLPPDGFAILNMDDEHADRVAEVCRGRGIRVIGVGSDADDLRLKASRPTALGQTIDIETFGRAYTLDLSLAGSFQASNALVAVGLAIACGADVDRAIKVLPLLTGVRGRMERVAPLKGGAAVYVDYAHTPDALQTVLAALRPHATNRLICVFGAGGDRDPGKREAMGTAARELADIQIVTDDNPRTENPAQIRRAVLRGAPGAIEIGDRAEAIGKAVDMLDDGDALIIAGKGHETYQILADRTVDFDDADVARIAVARREGRI